MMPRMRKLIDGRIVSNCSDEWRHECEARALMALPSQRARREALDTIIDKRGVAAADRLRVTMTAIWERARSDRV